MMLFVTLVRRFSIPVLVFLLLVVGLIWYQPHLAAAPATFDVQLTSAPTVAYPGSTVTIVWRVTGDQNVGINKVYYGWQPCATPPSCYPSSTTNQPDGPGTYTATLTVNWTIYFRVLAGTGLETKYTPEYVIRVPYVSDLSFSHNSRCGPLSGDTVTATWTADAIGFPSHVTALHWDTVSRADTHAYSYVAAGVPIGGNQYRAVLTMPGGVDKIFGAARLDVSVGPVWSGERYQYRGPHRFIAFRSLPPYLPAGRTVQIGWEQYGGDYEFAVQSNLFYDTVSHVGQGYGSYPGVAPWPDTARGNRVQVSMSVPNGERVYMRTHMWSGCGPQPESPEVSLPVQPPLEVSWYNTPVSATRDSTISVAWEVSGKQSVGLTRVEADYDAGENFYLDYQSPNQSGGMGVYTADVPVPVWAEALKLRALASDGVAYHSEVREIPLTGELQTATPTGVATSTSTPTASATPTATSTPTSTATNTKTATPTSTPTAQLSPTPTGTPTAPAEGNYPVYLPLLSRPLPPPPTPPALPPGVHILGNHSFYRSDTTLVVWGEVFNKTSSAIRSVRFPIDVYDSSGQLVHTVQGNPIFDNVPAYDWTCFGVVTSVPAPWSTYSFGALSYLTDGRDYPELTLFDVKAYWEEPGDYEIGGYVRNDSGEALYNVVVLATTYEDSKVVGCKAAFSEPKHLGANQIGSFKIPEVPYGSFRLQVDGVPELVGE